MLQVSGGCWVEGSLLRIKEGVLLRIKEGLLLRIKERPLAPEPWERAIEEP
jgi:hypothetical protein